MLFILIYWFSLKGCNCNCVSPNRYFRSLAIFPAIETMLSRRCPQWSSNFGFITSLPMGTDRCMLDPYIQETMENGRSYCNRFRSRLVETREWDTFDLVHFLRKRFKNNWFLGAHRSLSEEQYYWFSDGKPLSSVEINRFLKDGQPNYGSSEQCLGARTDGLLYDHECDQERKIMCEVEQIVCRLVADPFADFIFSTHNMKKCFALYKSQLMTPIESEKHCRSVNGFLAEMDGVDQVLYRDLNSGRAKEITESKAQYVAGFRLDYYQDFKAQYTGGVITTSLTASGRFLYINYKGEFETYYDHRLSLGHICQFDPTDYCRDEFGKGYFLVLGFCYYTDFKSDSTTTYDQCQSQCSLLGGKVPEPRTKLEFAALRLVIVHLTHVPIITGIKYLWPGHFQISGRTFDIDEIREMGATYIYETAKSYEHARFVVTPPTGEPYITFEKTSSPYQCVCKKEVFCPDDGSRCYAKHFDRENNVCVECAEAYFGADCSMECGGLVCDKNGNSWRKCQYGRWGYYCENYCSPYCLNTYTCHSLTGTCLGCLSGFYGYKCDKACGRCSYCDQQGHCTGGCTPGTYGPGCMHGCPINCRNGNCNFTTGICNECERGFYGQTCEQVCSGICDQNGNILVECPRGYYGDTCTFECDSRCADGLCSRREGTCDSCIEGSYGLYCEKRCTTKCNGCKKDGDCNFDCKLGYYGRYCDRICDSKCKNNDCDKDGYCRECYSGFYGIHCTKKCSTNSCDMQGNSLIECQAGIYGLNCDQVCSRTCLGGNCSQIGGTCNECVQGYYGSQCEYKCSPCDNCARNGACLSGCPSGTYGFDCTIKCKGACAQCNPSSGDCLECPIGKYGPNCTQNCAKPGTCNMTSGEDITGCSAGKFGEDCKSDCPSNCANNTCSFVLGSCFGCNAGYYGFKCQKKCSNCLLGCDQGGFCKQPEVIVVPSGTNATSQNASSVVVPEEEVTLYCSYGFYGSHCDKRCSQRCYLKACDENGKCLECPKGYYGDTCSLPCLFENCDARGENTSECIVGNYGSDCNKTCEQNCDGNCSLTLGLCDKCKKGFYGGKCRKKCMNCSQCDRNGICTDGCPRGTYGDHCELKCNTICRYSECEIKTGACKYCSPGKYGRFCEKECGNCIGVCNDAGDCLGKCFQGFYGPKCKKFCNSNCFLGICARDGKCQECNKGFYGDDCSNTCSYLACDFQGNEITACEETTYGLTCDKNCSFTCLERKCNQLSGNCLNCLQGLTGQYCNKVCKNCFECDRKGKCTSECYDGRWGTDCEKTCQGNCLNSRCDRNSGSCVECPNGFYGDTCGDKCLNSSLCDKTTGNPIIACKKGKFGQNCDQKCSKSCLNSTCSKDYGSCFACFKGLKRFGSNCESECIGCGLGCDMTGKCNQPSEAHLNKGKTECDFGWYGDSCEKTCPSDCLRGSCDETTGGCNACPRGKYGLDCVTDCPGTDCDVNGNVLKECPEGTYGENCENRCSRTCVGRLCSASGICLQCIQGFYGSTCSETCQGCSSCDEQGNCDGECNFGYYGPRCQSKCSSRCFAFNCEPTAGVCLECTDGFYGDFCDQKCKRFGRCDENGNSVSSCGSGKFGKNCEKNCSSSCKLNACSAAGSCFLCNEGFYGLTCDKECSNCNSCNQGGACVEVTRYDVVANKTIVIPRCVNGLTGENCDIECNPNCFASNCDDEGKCVECSDGTYGEECEKKCNGVCDINGNPIENKCEAGEYGPSCEFLCSPNCKDGECKTTSGSCLSCSKDRYGKLCEHKCQGTAACDRTGKPIEKCYPGLFGSRCEKKCSPNCLYGNCDEDGLCLECSKGYFGGDCQSKCNSTVCDVDTGEALTECPETYFGKDCDKKCSKACEDRLCSQTSGSCENCFEGFFGLKCKLRCINCAECKRSGECITECFPGFTGAKCDKGCPSNCFANTCDKSGDCVECAIGYHGVLCDEICPEKKLCDEDGNPIEACGKKYHGVNCTLRCSKSCRKGCSYILGICNDCKWKTYGRFCEHKCKRCEHGCDRQGLCYIVAGAAKQTSNVAGITASFILLILILAVLGTVMTGKAVQTLYFYGEEEGGGRKTTVISQIKKAKLFPMPISMALPKINFAEIKRPAFMRWKKVEEAVEEVIPEEQVPEAVPEKTMMETIIEYVTGGPGEPPPSDDPAAQATMMAGVLMANLQEMQNQEESTGNE